MPMYKKPLIALLFIAIAALIGTIYGSVTSDEVVKLDVATVTKNDSSTNKISEKAEINEESDDNGVNKIYVYVTGAVNKPGMVEIESNKDKIRIADAVEACGGLLPTADVDNFNMAEEITDGQHIRVPEKFLEHTNQNSAVAPTNNYSNNSSTATNNNNTNNGVNNNATISGGNNNGGIVNINTAGSAELQTLNGIGPKMAERIIEYRNTNGAFKSIEEIQNVKGIGAKTFEKMKNHIRI